MNKNQYFQSSKFVSALKQALVVAFVVGSNTTVLAYGHDAFRREKLDKVDLNGMCLKIIDRMTCTKTGAALFFEYTSYCGTTITLVDERAKSANTYGIYSQKGSHNSQNPFLGVAGLLSGGTLPYTVAVTTLSQYEADNEENVKKELIEAVDYLSIRGVHACEGLIDRSSQPTLRKDYLRYD